MRALDHKLVRDLRRLKGHGYRRDELARIRPADPAMLDQPATADADARLAAAGARAAGRGAPVEIAQWGSEPLPGRVRSVEPSALTRISALGVEEQRVNVIVAIDDPPPSLGDGFRVEARIQTGEGKDVLVVPASAVFRDREAWAVYAVVVGRARLTRVDLGRRGRLEVQIAGGLDEGATVILYPGDRVRDGVKVRPLP